MGGFLRDGKWITEDDWEKNNDGEFTRQKSSFREHIRSEEAAQFRPSPGRYHLYVSYACPWAHRTLIARSLLGLDEAISVTVVHPFMGDDGWEIRPKDDDDATPDPIFGAGKLYEIYQRADSAFTGRVTVPILWDREHGTIVNNESREILRMMSTQLRHIGHGDVDLCPEAHRAGIDAAMDRFYQPLNNGVYRCGFAGKQSAYERAFDELFAELEHWEQVLSEQRWVAGTDQPTEADICLFTTLVRFDPVYYVHFKCNGRLIRQFPALSGFVKDFYQYPGVRETVCMRHIKEHYYRSHPHVNPKGFVPVGPDLSWYEDPPERSSLLTPRSRTRA